jgi:hypothetical protein
MFNKTSKGIFISFSILLCLIVPTFLRMLRPGIFSMADPHLFRMYEYEQCLRDGQFPCRWSMNTAFGYGEPVFNFYSPFSYLYGQVFRMFGLSLIDSTKAVFIFSLILSGVSMFLFVRHLVKDNYVSLLSSLIYIYAPYRAVDIYVRGALPESLAFIFFPLILYLFYRYKEHKKKSYLITLGISWSLLIVTHNLSALIFALLFIPISIFFIVRKGDWKMLRQLSGLALLVMGLCAFYLLPVIAERQYVALATTTQGYFDFHNHFATIKELLFSKFWGYGASVWGSDDGLSLAIGYTQWILPLIVASLSIIYKKNRGVIIPFILMGWVFLWLTHNKSTFIWEGIPILAYIQFPWRFLSLSLFCFSVAGGFIVHFFSKPILKVIVLAIVTAALIALNTPFFFEDLWFDVNDTAQFSGQRFVDQTAMSINDYWPISAKEVPTTPAPAQPILLEGMGEILRVDKKSNSVVYEINVTSKSAILQAPIAYFPGWIGRVNDQPVFAYPSGKYGLVTAPVSLGHQLFSFEFKNTLERDLGNTISLVSLIIVVVLLFFETKTGKKTGTYLKNIAHAL